MFIASAGQSSSDAPEEVIYESNEGEEGASAAEKEALALVIVMCLITAVAGAASEEISFRRRLRHK